MFPINGKLSLLVVYFNLPKGNYRMTFITGVLVVSQELISVFVFVARGTL